LPFKNRNLQSRSAAGAAKRAYNKAPEWKAGNQQEAERKLAQTIACAEGIT
jgi:hypothetical protein